MTKLSIYADGVNRPATYVMEGETRSLYYAALRLIRYLRRNNEDVPYMHCTDAKLNFLLTCKRMSVNFGFAE